MTKRLLLSACAAVALVSAGLVGAGPASADQPCVGPSTFIANHGGGRCDYPPAADGSFTRCDTVFLFGYGATNCYRMPPGTPRL